MKEGIIPDKEIRKLVATLPAIKVKEDIIVYGTTECRMKLSDPPYYIGAAI